jgi:Flp pilus assembly protein TadD
MLVMNQISQITIPLENLFAPGEAPDASKADPMVIGIQVAHRYQFLPQPVVIEIVGSRVLLKYPAASDRAKAEAERLAKRAAQRAGNGDCHRAIAIWERVLKLIPDNLVARRDIGMACSELGDFTKARRYLSDALLLNFEDVGSLVALANIAFKEEDYVTAEIYAQKAVATDPQNAAALNSLGAVLVHNRRQDEALRLLRAALASDPELPTPYRSLAYLPHERGRHAEAEATLRAMFATARKQDIRDEPVFERARTFYRRVQESLAESQATEASRKVEEFRVAVETHTGCPIRVVEERSGEGPVAQVQFSWQHQRDHHLVRHQADYPATLMTHLLAHEFMHVRLGYDAHQAGRCRFFSLSPADREVALTAFETPLKRLVDEGFPLPWLADCVGRAVANLFGALYNYPLDLVVEQGLREELPVLAPAQFLGLTAPLSQEEQRDDFQIVSALMPRRFLRAYVGLRGVQLLFVDSICQGATNHAARFRNRDGFDLARKLWQHWQGRARALQPGDEYDLVDEFADLAGLQGSYTWLPDPGSTPPTTASTTT